MTTRKPIREFGREYDYLKDADLRQAEIGREHRKIENAEFNGEEFRNTSWGFSEFINCHFPASHLIQLLQLIDCKFTDCEFGPSRDDDTANFGYVRNGNFLRCTFDRGNISFTKGNASFDKCTFKNPNTDPNHGYFLSGPDLTLRNCQLNNYACSAREKLTLKKTSFVSSGAAGELHSKKYIADFILEDSTFENAEKILWNTKLKNLTISGCKAEVFRTQGVEVAETTLLERLETPFDLAGGSPDGKLHVRDCTFTEVDKVINQLFRCNGGYSKESLFERIKCSDAAPCNLTGAGPTTTTTFRLETTNNQTFTVRNCKIPHLKINWLQSHDLLIENCEIGTLELQDGLIGRVRIKATKFNRLLLERTLADTWEIEASGEIVPAGSNYPKGRKG